MLPARRRERYAERDIGVNARISNAGGVFAAIYSIFHNSQNIPLVTLIGGPIPHRPVSCIKHAENSAYPPREIYFASISLSGWINQNAPQMHKRNESCIEILSEPHAFLITISFSAVRMMPKLTIVVLLSRLIGIKETRGERGDHRFSRVRRTVVDRRCRQATLTIHRVRLEAERNARSNIARTCEYFTFADYPAK